MERLTFSNGKRKQLSELFGLEKLSRPPACRQAFDLGLWLVSEIAGRELAEVIQLYIEYDPKPPFNSGHVTEETQRRAKEMMDQAMSADQRRLVPKIAWRRFIDLARTRK